MKNKILSLFMVVIIILTMLVYNGCTLQEAREYTIGDILSYSGQAYIEINNNQPYFTSDEMVTISFEDYDELDSLGRCGVATACIGQDIMPEGERGSIGYVKPSGWQTAKYDFVDGKYLYNRCHLIGWQLTGENANERNLITGTRYMNIEGMLDFENAVDDYIETTGNHVLYRVTPIFEGNNLLASGVQMEGYSVEDKGRGICFNVYAYNVQPGIEINYANGDSHLAGEGVFENTTSTLKAENNSADYVLNKNSQKIHLPDCSSVKDMKPQNKKVHSGSVENPIDYGYTNCKTCIESLNTYWLDDDKIIHKKNCSKAQSTEKYVGVLGVLVSNGYTTCDTCQPE